MMKNVYLYQRISMLRDVIYSYHVYLSHVRKYGGVETRLMVYMEYLMISVMVQANSRRGNPMDSCEGGSM